MTSVTCVTPRQPRMSQLTSLLTCALCGGYFIDATTVSDCLHTFCRSCILRHLEASSSCPLCQVAIQRSRSTCSLRLDTTIQRLVYKMVPGLFENEMSRRRRFYHHRPYADPELATWTKGHVESHVPHVYVPTERVHVRLYAATCSDTLPNTSRLPGVVTPGHVTADLPPPRYLLCAAGTTVSALRKLLENKLQLCAGPGPQHGHQQWQPSSMRYQARLIHKRRVLSDDLTLMDVGYMYNIVQGEMFEIGYQVTRKRQHEEDQWMNNSIERKADEVLISATGDSADANRHKRSRMEDIKLPNCLSAAPNMPDTTVDAFMRPMFDEQDDEEDPTSPEVVDDIIASLEDCENGAVVLDGDDREAPLDNSVKEQLGDSLAVYDGVVAHEQHGSAVADDSGCDSMELDSTEQILDDCDAFDGECDAIETTGIKDISQSFSCDGELNRDDNTDSASAPYLVTNTECATDSVTQVDEVPVNSGDVCSTTCAVTNTLDKSDVLDETVSVDVNINENQSDSDTEPDTLVVDESAMCEVEEPLHNSDHCDGTADSLHSDSSDSERNCSEMLKSNSRSREGRNEFEGMIKEEVIISSESSGSIENQEKSDDTQTDSMARSVGDNESTEPTRLNVPSDSSPTRPLESEKSSVAVSEDELSKSRSSAKICIEPVLDIILPPNVQKPMQQESELKGVATNSEEQIEKQLDEKRSVSKMVDCSVQTVSAEESTSNHTHAPSEKADVCITTSPSVLAEAAEVSSSSVAFSPLVSDITSRADSSTSTFRALSPLCTSRSEIGNGSNGSSSDSCILLSFGVRNLIKEPYLGKKHASETSTRLSPLNTRCAVSSASQHKSPTTSNQCNTVKQPVDAVLSRAGSCKQSARSSSTKKASRPLDLSTHLRKPADSTTTLSSTSRENHIGSGGCRSPERKTKTERTQGTQKIHTIVDNLANRRRVALARDDSARCPRYSTTSALSSVSCSASVGMTSSAASDSGQPTFSAQQSRLFQPHQLPLQSSAQHCSPTTPSQHRQHSMFLPPASSPLSALTAGCFTTAELAARVEYDLGMRQLMALSRITTACRPNSAAVLPLSFGVGAASLSSLAAAVEERIKSSAMLQPASLGAATGRLVCRGVENGSQGRSQSVSGQRVLSGIKKYPTTAVKAPPCAPRHADNRHESLASQLSVAKISNRKQVPCHHTDIEK